MGYYQVTRVINGEPETFTVEAATAPAACDIADQYKADAEASRRQAPRRSGGDRRRRERRR